MIVVVAPYSPPGRSVTPHLGAARKIEAIISILSQLGMPLLLVNTAHDGEKNESISLRETVVAGVVVKELIPPKYANRRYGKLRNLLDVSSVVNHVLKIGMPKFVWLYNGYAMESKLGVGLKAKSECRIIQEMEDWHFSRHRGLNPKPYIDWYFWRSAARVSDHVFSVNEVLAKKIRKLNHRVSILPGIVTDEIASIRTSSPPFNSVDKPIVVGYFGGLSAEKGADLVLDLCNVLPDGFKFVITGSGSLQEKFSVMSSGKNSRMEFHGSVDDETLVELIGSCDVLLNPHSSIVRMSNGVFPFKVIESIATGRLLISTELPSEGLRDVLQGVVIVEHDLNSLANAIIDSKNVYKSRRSQVIAGADAAVSRFGKKSILDAIRSALPDWIL